MIEREAVDSRAFDETPALPARSYWCFISYRHLDNTEPGREWASWLHHGLETFRVPADLVGKTNDRGETIPEQIFPVFRDEEELAGGDLDEGIREALQNAKSLVVICSPRTVDSVYVDKEVRIYKQLRAQEERDGITPQRSEPLVAVIEGDPQADPDSPDACLVESLRYQVDEGGEITDREAPDSLWTDFRLPDGTQGWTSRGAYREELERQEHMSNREITELAEAYDERISTARLRIIAGVLGVPLGKLQRREETYRLAQARRQLFETSFLFGSRTASDELALRSYWRARYALADDDRRVDAVHSIIRGCSGRLPLPLPHDQRVTAAAFHPDGKRVVTAGADGIVRFWDVENGAPTAPALNLADGADLLSVGPDGTVLVGSSAGDVHVLGSRDSASIAEVNIGAEPITALEFSADGKRFLAQSGSQDGSTFEVFDTAGTTSVLRSFVAEEVFPATALKLSPDGKHVLMGGFEGDLWVVPVDEQPAAPTFGAGGSTIDFLEFSPGGDHFISVADRSATVWAWDGRSHTEVHDKIRHEDSISALAFSADGALVATASLDRTAQVWNLKTGEPFGPKLWHEGSVRTVAFDHAAGRLLCGTETPAIRIWSVPGGDPVASLACDSTVRSAMFSPDGRHVAYITNGTVGRIWEPEAQPDPPSPRGEVGHGKSVTRVAYDPAGARLVTGSADGTSRVWDATQLEPVTHPLEQHRRNSVFPPSVVTAIAISGDGRLMATGGGGNIDIWDLESGSKVAGGLTHGHRIFALDFAPDSRKLLSASGNGSAQLWDADRGDPLGPPLEHEHETPSENKVLDAKFSPDGGLVATAGGNGMAILWDTDGDPAPRHKIPHRGAVTSIAFSPNGELLATGCADANARLWSVASGDPRSDRLAHSGGITAMAFSPDGKLLVTVSDDRTARMWNAVTGASEGEPLRHPAGVRCVAFRSDSSMFATGDESGAARIWDSLYGIPVGGWLQHPDVVTSIVFHPDGRHLATGCVDGKARVWPAIAPDSDDADRLRWYSEYKSGQFMDETQLGTPLGYEAWAQRRE